MTNERKQTALSKARSFKHSKTTISLLYSIYQQRAGKTCLFYVTGGDVTHFNTCTFKALPDSRVKGAIRRSGLKFSVGPPETPFPCLWQIDKIGWFVWDRCYGPLEAHAGGGPLKKPFN